VAEVVDRGGREVEVVELVEVDSRDGSDRGEVKLQNVVLHETYTKKS